MFYRGEGFYGRHVSIKVKISKIISSLKDNTTVRESREDRRKRRQMEKKVTKTLDQICKDMTNNFFVDDAEGAANRGAIQLKY